MGALGVGIALLVGAGCSGGALSSTSVLDATTTTPRPTRQQASTTPQGTTTTAVNSTSTTSTLPAVVDVLAHPLTGVPVAELAEINDRPALAVKLSNHGPDAIPQGGLNHADIVFEEIINDETTRLAAVFHSDDADIVGPVRSGRTQDIDILQAFDSPLYGWSGGNRYVTKSIADSKLIDLSAMYSGGYYRRPGRKAPNNLYTSTDSLWAQAPVEAGRPEPVFDYLAPKAAVPGRVANRVEVVLDSTLAVWRYDPISRRYLRTQNGARHMTESGSRLEQVWADNVVVMVADYGVDPADGNPRAEMRGSNTAYVFSGGNVQAGVWMRFSPEDPFGLFVDVDGKETLQLRPGRTWVEIPRNRQGTVSFS